MMKEAYSRTVKEAVDYEKDDYAEHTVEAYMKENAMLAAAFAADSMKEAYNEAKESEINQETFEATCNEMKEAYAKKMDEMKEAFGASGEEAQDDATVGPAA